MKRIPALLLLATILVAGVVAPPAAGSDDGRPSVFAIGDSNMYRAAVYPYQDLPKAVPGIKVDAADNRQFFASVQVLADRLAEGPPPDVLVVALGTNGEVHEEDVTDLMALAAPIENVIFVNVQVPRFWEDQVNTALDDAVAKYRKALLADWNTVSEGHPEYLRPDGFHFTAAGSAVWSDLIADTIAKSPPPFVDIDDTVFANDIVWLRYNGITKGCNPPMNDRYCPEDRVTRGQMAAFLVRALGLTDDGGGNRFTDDNGSTFEPDIAKLAAAGITKGCNPPSNTRYCPNDSVTRGQMAAFLVRALDLTEGAGSNAFTDDNGSTFEADIERLAAAGITRGCNPPSNTRFCPDDRLTRGQMAAFIRRAIG